MGQVGELENQIDNFEAELEGLSVKKGKQRPPRLVRGCKIVYIVHLTYCDRLKATSFMFSPGTFGNIHCSAQGSYNEVRVNFKVTG